VQMTPTVASYTLLRPVRSPTKNMNLHREALDVNDTHKHVSTGEISVKNCLLEKLRLSQTSFLA